MLEGLGVICVLFGIGILMAGCAWLAWWMLEPINRVAGELQGTTRFMLTDAIGLMILLQIGLAITGRALSGVGDESAAALYWFLLCLMGILILVLWAASVSVVSRAGITRPLQRIAVMVLCVPGTLVVMVTLPALVGFAAFGALFLVVNHENDIWNRGSVLLMAGGCLVLSGVAILLRRIAFWSLAGSPGGELLARK